jgi:transcriptional antiterminator NusG
VTEGAEACLSDSKETMEPINSESETSAAGLLEHAAPAAEFLTDATGELFPWYALRVKSNFEWVTASILREKGFREFLPVYKAKVRWSDRLKLAERPLFPGYVFCQFDANQRLPIVSTPGVVHVVGIGKRPVAIDNQEMEAISTIVRSGGPAMPWPFLQVGERVLVERGPLAGLEGILVSLKSSCRIVVTISLLQRSIAVEIEREWVRPLPGLAFCGAYARNGLAGDSVWTQIGR